MGEKILIISDTDKDLELFAEILEPKGFDVAGSSICEEIEDAILKDVFDAILADYDLIGDRVYNWIGRLQENSCRSCFILYGETIKAAKVSEILQKGAYGFIPRALLPERILDTIIGGLENRKAFVEILGMVDELRDVNERLEREKEALRAKNQELGFISRLSNEVAYDLNWDRILPRILDAGLPKVIDHELISILYRIGSKWELTLHLSGRGINEETLERLKENTVNRFYTLSRERISTKDIALRLYPPNAKASTSSTIPFSKEWAVPLRLAGKPLGLLVFLPKNREEFKAEKKELMSTISNILAISLKNAQEYHRLKEMAVTDGLTGIFNYKGFRDFIQRELQRAKRYKKPLSLIMIDVDSFKAINDSLGHQAGDYVLRELAGCLKSSVRNSDIVARYGGDEFAVLLPETEMGKAEVLVKRMSHVIKNYAFEWGSERINVDISYGISAIGEMENEEGEAELIDMADARLYTSKRSRIYAPSTSGLQ
jgi:diguanylate cyclase (GGDEF)-like protein